MVRWIVGLPYRFKNENFYCVIWVKTYQNDGGIRWKVCNEINTIIFRLFIYSIIWRCSVSSSELCHQFSLSPNEEENLRQILNRFRNDRQNEFLDKIAAFDEPFFNIPFIIFTASSFRDRTGNTLFVNPDIRNPYQFILNEYILIFSFQDNDLQNKFKMLNNTDVSPIKMGFFDEETWDSIRNQFLKRLVEKARTFTNSTQIFPENQPKSQS